MIRIAARGLSLVSIIIIGLFFFGYEGSIFSIQWNEALMFLFFPIGIILGMLIGWKYEFTGGAISVLSLALFYAIHFLVADYLPKGPFFFLFTLPGFLFFALGFKNQFYGTTLPEDKKSFTQHGVF